MADQNTTTSKAPPPAKAPPPKSTAPPPSTAPLPSTAPAAAPLPTTAPAAAPGSAKKPTTVEEIVNTLQSRVTNTQRNLDAMADEARKTKAENNVQFQSITATLAAIMQVLKPTAPSPSNNAENVTVHIDDIDDQQQPASNAQASIIDRAHSSASSIDVRHQASRKLHDLPTFSGAPEDWPKFHAMYQQSTEAYGYSALDNSIRLQRCLVGDAKEAVDCLLLDVNATPQVIEALQFRFGRPELLAQAQLRRVREIAHIPETRAEQIVPFASKVANMLAYLDQPKTRHYLVNPELLEQLVQKLPLSRRHDWGRHAVDIEPCATIAHFSTWLNDLARCVSFMTPAVTLAGTSMPTSMPQARSRPSHALPPATLNRRERTFHAAVGVQPRCGVCDIDGHDTTDCRRFSRMNVEERWQATRQNRLCFRCLRRGHGSYQCELRTSCGVDRCTMPHNKLLHQSTQSNYSTQPTQRRNPFGNSQRSDTATQLAIIEPAESSNRPVGGNSSGNTSNVERVNTCSSVANVARIMFRILPVKLYGNERVVKTFALLDEGSSVTMLDNSIADELGLSGPSSTLQLQWFGSQNATERSRTVSLRISGTSSRHQQFELANVRTVRNLNLPAQTIKMTDLCSRFQPLRGLPVEDYSHAVPKMLIGLDNIHLGVATQQISCSAPGPVATNTRLGWVVCGPNHQSGNAAAVLQCHETTTSLAELHDTVREFFSLESFGVRHIDRPLESRDDTRAREIMTRTTVRIGDRYETGLLWRTDSVRLPESKAMATNRLLSVERKMHRDSAFAAQYIGIIDNYIEQGYARRLTAGEAARNDERTWYLPHFAVTNINKPGKMRVVFDAAAEVQGISLNSALLKGPDLTRSLIAVLHQFRIGAVGVCADIKEMFLQVNIRAEDVNSQRFLWRRGDASKPIDVYVMTSMIFGAACSPSSAQFVKNTNADRYIDSHPTAVNLIKNSHYVDDYVSSFDTTAEAITNTKDVVNIHREAGFQLRGFTSNASAVMREFGSDAVNGSTLDMQLDNDKTEKILGMHWNTNEDAFQFRLAFGRVDPAVVAGSRSPTKREMLSAVMSVYDPFGLLANFTIYAKLLLQDLWRHGTGWDEPIPMAMNEKWRQWVNKLDVCREVRVARCYTPNIARKRVQLHVFADASQSAFATVAYWRIEVEPGQWDVVFVSGKARCAPPKLISIPRLELQAAVMAVRLKNSIRSTHDFAIDSTFFWTDSKTVVQWVRSEHMQFRQFVAHRINEILVDTTVAEWHWLPTNHNAADDATRAKYPVRYTADNRWLRGPDFLFHADSQWPAEPADMLCTNGTEEVHPRSVQLVCTELTTAPSTTVQITRFSDFHRACRSMAFSLRFINNARAGVKQNGELQPTEIEEAERWLIRAAQAESFAMELATMKAGMPIDKSSALHSYLPHMDQHGIIRMTGRIDKAAHLPEEARNPIIMPKNHHLTKILIATYHRRMRHQQQAAVVGEIRLKYWVPHLRVLVRRAKNECMLCRIKSARPVEQIMGQLPADRLTPYVKPFTYTGVDYFGPLSVTIGRRREKRWVALFTCMTVRAVHLELASNLSTDAFIICLRNFMNIRGVPKKIRSDNGTNFVGANRELRESIDLLDHAAIQRELSINRVEWQFNCPNNPEAGGCWERLVQSVKKVLSVSLNEIAPQVETLRSLLLEAANIVNSRPLTHLPVTGDEDEPLTPNHFLLGTASSTQTPGSDDARLLCMKKQWRICQTLKNMFWKRWMQEYLPDLTRRAKGFVEQPALVVGSLVLICDHLLPRGQWKRGRVTHVYPGSDGRIRTASVKTMDGEFKRPLSKLAVLNIE